MVAHSELAERLRGVITGDPSDVAWLYDTFGGRLYRRLKRRYGRPGGPEAEDLLQDAFVFYLQHGARVLRRFLDQGAPEPSEAGLERYLWDLACGLASNYRRSQKRGTWVPLAPEQVSPAPGAERSTIERDRLDRLLACLEAAGSRIFLYFKLRFEDGLAPSDIARVTGWSMKATYKLRPALDQAVESCRQSLGLDGEAL